MATRRKPTKQRRAGVDEAVWRWLCDENPEERDETGEIDDDIFMLKGEWIHHRGGEGDGLKKLWRDVESDVLDYWIPLHPGTRPARWWWYSAPRIPVGGWEETAGSYMDGKFAEPRLRVSGGGGAPWEMGFNYFPWFEHGIPTCWVCLDPKDPPRFESQAHYLRRHGLLTAQEMRILKPSDFEPESPAIPEDEVLTEIHRAGGAKNYMAILERHRLANIEKKKRSRTDHSER